MLRTIDILMIGLLLGAAAFTFKIKQDSETAINRVSKLENKIKAEEDAIDVLEADWSLLSDPGRLEMLIGRYKEQLPLIPTDPKSIATIEEIPPKPIRLPEPSEGGIAGLIETDSQLTTGAIGVEGSDAPGNVDSGAVQQ